MCGRFVARAGGGTSDRAALVAATTSRRAGALGGSGSGSGSGLGDDEDADDAAECTAGSLELTAALRAGVSTAASASAVGGDRAAATAADDDNETDDDWGRLQTKRRARASTAPET